MAELRQFDSVEVYECKNCERTLVYGEYKLGNNIDFDEAETCENCDKRICGDCQSTLALKTYSPFKETEPKEECGHVFCDECLEKWKQGELNDYYYFVHPNKISCRECGCTSDHLSDECEEDGGCYWVEGDLCSTCAEKNEIRKEDDEKKS